MNFRLGAALACASILTLSTLGCAGEDAFSGQSASLDTDDQKASYGIGMNMGSQLVAAADRLDMAALMRGIEDALQENEPAVPREEIQPILQAFGAEVEAAAAADRAQEAEENATAGEAFLAENAAKEGVTTTESGLQYEVLREGEGERPTTEDLVRVHYRGMLPDGTEFDSSYGGDPAEFSAAGLIPGFREALTLMPVGSHYRVVIPPDIGYGSTGSGPIGPNSTLIFEIELLEIVDGE